MKQVSLRLNQASSHHRPSPSLISGGCGESDGASTGLAADEPLLLWREDAPPPPLLRLSLLASRLLGPPNPLPCFPCPEGRIRLLLTRSSFPGAQTQTESGLGMSTASKRGLQNSNTCARESSVWRFPTTCLLNLSKSIDIEDLLTVTCFIAIQFRAKFGR